jgi:hypothetical protein
MFGKLVLIFATVSQARHLRGPGEYNMTTSPALTGAAAGAGAGAGAVNSSFSLVPYYQPKRKFPMCPPKQQKQVAVYNNATAFRREL